MNGIAVASVASVVVFSAAFAASTARSATETVVYSFCSLSRCPDGEGPKAGLIDVKGTLYGTTVNGGVHGHGTVFTIDRATGAERVLHAFEGGDGHFPYGGLIHWNGNLYGTAINGGTDGCSGFGCGTVFAITPTRGKETVLYAFSGGADGADPEAGVTNVNGTLYGTTAGGGDTSCSGGCGTVFSTNPERGGEIVLHTFKNDGNDGYHPAASLFLWSGLLYGTTTDGGGKGLGTIFSFDPATGVETVLYAFGGGSDGAAPQATLTDLNGTLYGTTSEGGGTGCGGTGCGTVFSLDPTTGTEAVLHAFAAGADGSAPIAGLLKLNGVLYGTTYFGGSSCDGGAGCGTVFSIDPTTGAEAVLYAFAGGPDGAFPASGLLNVNGTFYGTTIAGGAHEDAGTVFMITP